MAIRPFLAMTAAEIRNCTHLPQKIAWMACHFSPYGTGLSNLSPSLPEGSLLIVDDITPIRGHDPEVIAGQLIHCLDMLKLSGILLDFQRPDNQETAELTAYLSEVLSCPMAVTEAYAKDSSGLPVFLSPVPPSVALHEHFCDWAGREIWLDLGRWGEVLTLTVEGCNAAALPPWEIPENGLPDPALHCHYHIEENKMSAKFTLWRTEEDLSDFLKEAEELGIKNAVGLYQEWNRFNG